MKKLIVLLLAFAMVGAVSAQVTTAVSLSGAVTLVDEAGLGVFTPDGDGYDMLTFKATDKDGKFGLSATDSMILSGDLTFRDWTVWGKILGGKMSVGLLRDATFRITLPYWSDWTKFGGTDRVSGMGAYYVSNAMNGLTFGVNLPYSLAGGAALDTLKNADLGVKYDAKGVGVFALLMNLDLDAAPGNVLNAGFKFTGVEKLTATAIAQAKFNANTYKAALGIGYTGVDKLEAYFEAAYLSTAGVSTYSVWAQGDYAVTDLLVASLGGAYMSNGYDVYAYGTYDLGAGFSAEARVGFDAALYASAKLIYAISL